MIRRAIDGIGMRALRCLPAETAHGLSLLALKAGLGPKHLPAAAHSLQTEFCGLSLPNPLGLAAGYDKNAETANQLFGLGFGFVEVGAVTPRPQAGNPGPRLFRLSDDRAVINRMGFNNLGLEVMKRRLERRSRQAGLLGVNIGANKDSEDRVADYVLVLRELEGVADFFTINISSPNTEKLRDLQGVDALSALLERVMDARETTPVLLKIAPDLTGGEIEDIARVALGFGIDGLIATNTTLARPEELQSPLRGEAGGLSGAPLFARSTEVLRQLALATEQKLPLIGVGGISEPAQAYAKIRAGASLVQLYSALVYEGPSLPLRIIHGLETLLERDGFSHISQAVGVDLKTR